MAKIAAVAERSGWDVIGIDQDAGLSGANLSLPIALSSAVAKQARFPRRNGAALGRSPPNLRNEPFQLR